MGITVLMWHDTADDQPFDDFFQDASVSDPLAPDYSAIEVKAPPRLGLLKDLEASEFDSIARTAKLQFHDANTRLFNQGDISDRFFILVDGELDVVRDGERIATLTHGAFFGESGLLTGATRSASIVAKSAVSVWSIDYETFEAVIAEKLLADPDFRAVIEARLSAS